MTTPRTHDQLVQRVARRLVAEYTRPIDPGYPILILSDSEVRQCQLIGSCGRPSLRRIFDEEDERPGGTPVCRYHASLFYWRTVFDDPGRELIVNPLPPEEIAEAWVQGAPHLFPGDEG